VEKKRAIYDADTSDDNGSDDNGSDDKGSDGNGSDGNGSDGNGSDGNGSDGNGSDGNGFQVEGAAFVRVVRGKATEWRVIIDSQVADDLIASLVAGDGE
jgi:hypothetical protein